MSLPNIDTVNALRNELCNLRRHLTIRERGKPHPYMCLGNVALLPIKRPSQSAPLVVHLGCGIFVEKSDSAIKARVANVLDSIKEQEERLNKELRDSIQNLREEDSVPSVTLLNTQQKTKVSEPSVRYELSSFIFEDDPHTAIVEHKTVIQKRSEPRRIRSQFAIERL
ncbi:Hypothetical protein GSB_153411 [Giardia duodenalis]|uniref:Prefoldin subunit n=1 Tax=Giardia intestinalis TaxID=5741 RepID=V6TR60_GIAIN|nr:Hypothetical protein GSB_153411 [Giardia intestinalis]